MDNLTLNEFLKILANADGGDAIELVSQFQSGALCVEGISALDFDDED